MKKKKLNKSTSYLVCVLLALYMYTTSCICTPYLVFLPLTCICNPLHCICTLTLSVHLILYLYFLSCVRTPDLVFVPLTLRLYPSPCVCTPHLVFVPLTLCLYPWPCVCTPHLVFVPLTLCLYPSPCVCTPCVVFVDSVAVSGFSFSDVANGQVPAVSDSFVFGQSGRLFVTPQSTRNPHPPLSSVYVWSQSDIGITCGPTM